MTIKQNIIQEYNVKNSKFIVLLIKIDDCNIKEHIKKIKQEYKSATHYCFAYIFNDLYKYSDDKEPSFSAGIQIYNALNYNKLNQVLCVVVRYFGGTKLGVATLAKTYFNCVLKTIENAELIEISNKILIELSFNYQFAKQVNSLLKKEDILKKNFNEKVKYQLYIEEDEFLKIIDDLKRFCDIDIKKR